MPNNKLGGIKNLENGVIIDVAAGIPADLDIVAEVWEHRRMVNGAIVDDGAGNAAINTVVSAGDNPTQKNSIYTVDDAGNLAYRTVSKNTNSSDLSGRFDNLESRMELLESRANILAEKIEFLRGQVNPLNSKVDLLANPPTIWGFGANKIELKFGKTTPLADYTKINIGANWFNPVKGEIEFTKMPYGLYLIEMEFVVSQGNPDKKYELYLGLSATGSNLSIFNTIFFQPRVPRDSSLSPINTSFRYSTIYKSDKSNYYNRLMAVRTNTFNPKQFFIERYELKVRRIGD